MTSARAAWFCGAMTCTPATPGVSANSRMSSMQIFIPSDLGSAERSSRVMIPSGISVPYSFSFQIEQARRIAAYYAGIHAKLGLDEIGARLQFGEQPVGTPAGGRIDRDFRRAEDEFHGAFDLGPCRQPMLRAHPVRHREQARGIEIENRFGVRLIARLRIVPAQREHVPDAERRGAEQLALQRDPVAVAAGELQDRLDAVSHEKVRSGEAGHMRPGARSVGHVDRGREAAQRERPVDEFGGIARNRRCKLGGDHEAPATQLSLQFACGVSRRLFLRGQIHVRFRSQARV